MRERKSKLRGCAVAVLSVVAVLALVVFVGRAAFRKVGGRQLAAVTQQLDAEDPGWRIEAIEARRQEAAPPPDENPARVALDAVKQLPAGWDHLLSDAGVGPVWNTYPGFWQLVAHLGASAAAGDAPAAARDGLLRPAVMARPGGFITVVHQDNPFTTLLPDVQNLRRVFALLEADARVAVLAGDPGRAVRDALAILVAARGIGDEPFLISQLVRMAGANVAARTAMQVLAWGEPADGLAELQAELLAEAAHPGYLLGLRGERAMMDKLFDGLESGKLGAEDLRYLEIQQRAPQFLQEAGLVLYRGFLPGDRAECLRVLTEYVAAARLPIHEQKAAIAAVPLPPRPPESYRYLISGMILPAVDRVHAAYLRTRADLRTAAVAIACERFRQKTGRWPESLAEIPKDILPDLPTDPATGGPLRYERTDDGVMVFGVEADDRRPQVIREEDPLGGRGRGWRLWDPKHRGKTLPAPDREFIPEAPAEGDDP